MGPQLERSWCWVLWGLLLKRVLVLTWNGIPLTRMRLYWRQLNQYSGRLKTAPSPPQCLATAFLLYVHSCHCVLALCILALCILATALLLSAFLLCAILRLRSCVLHYCCCIFALCTLAIAFWLCELMLLHSCFLHFCGCILALCTLALCILALCILAAACLLCALLQLHSCSMQTCLCTLAFCILATAFLLLHSCFLLSCCCMFALCTLAIAFLLCALAAALLLSAFLQLHSCCVRSCFVHSCFVHSCCCMFALFFFNFFGGSGGLSLGFRVLCFVFVRLIATISLFKTHARFNFTLWHMCVARFIYLCMIGLHHTNPRLGTSFQPERPWIIPRLGFSADV